MAAADGGLATDQSPKEWPGNGGLPKRKHKLNVNNKLNVFTMTSNTKEENIIPNTFQNFFFW